MSRQVPRLERRRCATLPPDILDEWFWAGNSIPKQQPVHTTQEAWDKAKDVCRECPVLEACAEIGMNEEYGVWGGTDQHERFLMRKRRSRPLSDYSTKERLEVGKQIAFLRKHPHPMPWDVITRQVGLTRNACLILLDEHVKDLRAKQAARSTAAQKVEAAKWRAAAEEVPAVTVPFPPGAPEGRDGWVRYQGMAVPAFYVAQTPTADQYLMRVKQGRQPMTKWFLARDVRLDRPVGVAIRERPYAKSSA